MNGTFLSKEQLGDLKIIDRKIKFHLAKNPQNAFNNTITAYNKVSQSTTSTNAKNKSSEHGLFDPSIVEKLRKWENIRRVGPGFFNLGNTCFLNSTLQCLLYLPPLSQVLNNESIKIMPNKSDNTSLIIQHYQRLTQEVFSNNTGKPISPRAMVQNIRQVGKQFRPMRQEDAHEYLRKLIDCMHEEILKQYHMKNKNDTKITETTVIYRIFGGILRNELKCNRCKYSSKTYNSFLDLSLEIGKGVSSVLQAMKMFTTIEKLSSGNEWHCDGCKRKVQATKQLTISKCPTVLVLHLKRFVHEGMFNKKINKHIEFSMDLSLPCSDVSPSSSSSQQSTIEYTLMGIITHYGGSIHSGHYVAFIKAPNNMWYEMNDSHITQISPTKVLQQQAYLLFYVRKSDTLSKTSTENPIGTTVFGALNGTTSSVSTTSITTIPSPQILMKPIISTKNEHPPENGNKLVNTKENSTMKSSSSIVQHTSSPLSSTSILSSSSITQSQYTKKSHIFSEVDDRNDDDDDIGQIVKPPPALNKKQTNKINDSRNQSTIVNILHKTDNSIIGSSSTSTDNKLKDAHHRQNNHINTADYNDASDNDDMNMDISHTEYDIKRPRLVPLYSTLLLPHRWTGKLKKFTQWRIRHDLKPLRDINKVTLNIDKDYKHSSYQRLSNDNDDSDNNDDDNEEEASEIDDRNRYKSSQLKHIHESIKEEQVSVSLDSSIPIHQKNSNHTTTNSISNSNSSSNSNSNSNSSRNSSRNASLLTHQPRNIESMILEASRRGRELGGEGIWGVQSISHNSNSNTSTTTANSTTKVTSESTHNNHTHNDYGTSNGLVKSSSPFTVIEKDIQELVTYQRREEQLQNRHHNHTSKRLYEWNQLLDQGKQKKIKTKNDFSNTTINSEQNGKNPFQIVHNQFMNKKLENW